MRRILFLTLAIAFACVRSDHCDSLGTRFHDEIGCTPNLGNDGCPISYDCPDITVPDGFCKFGGKLYQYGEYVNGTSNCRPAICSPGMGPMIHDCFQRPDEDCYLA
ncbi:PREDICTED: uncharacterized protein LOC108559711 [Nicrophorus vespilloides]|uniref:Uncharacterized protein LOC108559711 n=1 Tax=Nicrophorus vespilloides TaxID=110193 RepID=A0ABM1MD92_NICVS|nr:PREDICTED: uncharacterized protein LOC108559711 [Nicrophorus vespilloides]